MNEVLFSQLGIKNDSDILNFQLKELEENLMQDILKDFTHDFHRYYPDEDIEFQKVKYFRGLLATLFYRISRRLFLDGKDELALEYSSFAFYLTGIELYFSADIGKGLKINHGIGLVVGARVRIGEQALLHHNITVGEKNGRPSIGNNVTVYPGAVIVGEIHVGDHCTIGANTFLDKDLNPNTIYK